MSYSFNIRASSKDEAKSQIAAEFDKIVLSQPVHKADRDAAQTAAGAFVDMLADPGDNEEIHINAHGSVSWKGENDFTHSAFTVNVGLAPGHTRPIG